MFIQTDAPQNFTTRPALAYNQKLQRGGKADAERRLGMDPANQRGREIFGHGFCRLGSENYLLLARPINSNPRGYNIRLRKGSRNASRDTSGGLCKLRRKRGSELSSVFDSCGEAAGPMAGLITPFQLLCLL